LEKKRGDLGLLAGRALCSSGQTMANILSLLEAVKVNCLSSSYVGTRYV
jgi:hypothetical protein